MLVSKKLKKARTAKERALFKRTKVMQSRRAKLRQKSRVVNPVLDEHNCDPALQINVPETVNRIVTLAQLLAEKSFYPYQSVIAYRIVESVLLHDGEVLTALISRQSGKTETLSAIVAAMIIILPALAREHPGSWHLNITDEKGVYRGFRDGIKIGIYAPRKEQAKIAFDRVRGCFDRELAQSVMTELGIVIDTFNGNTIKLSNGARAKCESASDQSKIEGETYHLLVLEEAQDISDQKVRKSLHPMVSSLMGTILKVGTSKAERCDFYEAIKANQRAEVEGRNARKNHFIFSYKVCQKYNSHYREYIAKEKVRIGEESDEFRMAYGCEWVFERGMFVTQNVLFDPGIAQTGRLPWNQRYEHGQLPKPYRFYSIVAGIDWGSASDSTVLTLVAVNWNAPIDTLEQVGLEGGVNLYQKHVVDWIEWQGDDYETQFHEVIEYLRQVPGLTKLVTDSNTCGLPIFNRLQHFFEDKEVEVTPFNFSSRVKSEGYKSLYHDLCGQRITFPASPATRQTMEYRKFIQQTLDLRKKYKGGLMVVSHPDEKNAHDDYPDSLMMAADGASVPSIHQNFEFSNSNPFT